MIKINLARKLTLLTLCFLITIMAMQRYAMDDDTLWHCDLTVKMNATKNSGNEAKMSIKMGTSLEKKCWFVKQIGESLVVSNADKVISKPVTICQEQRTWYRYRINLSPGTMATIGESELGMLLLPFSAELSREKITALFMVMFHFIHGQTAYNVLCINFAVSFVIAKK